MSLQYIYIGKSKVIVKDENGVLLGNLNFIDSKWFFHASRIPLNRIQLRRIYNKLELLEKKNEISPQS